MKSNKPYLEECLKSNYLSEKLRFLLYQKYWKSKKEGICDFTLIDVNDMREETYKYHLPKFNEILARKDSRNKTLQRFFGTLQDASTITKESLDDLSYLYHSYEDEQFNWEDFVKNTINKTENQNIIDLIVATSTDKQPMYCFKFKEQKKYLYQRVSSSIIQYGNNAEQQEANNLQNQETESTQSNTPETTNIAKELGLESIINKAQEHEVEKIILSAEEEIKLAANWFRPTIPMLDELFKQREKENIKKNIKIKFLLIKPNTEIAERRSLDEGFDIFHASIQINNCLKELKQRIKKIKNTVNSSEFENTTIIEIGITESPLSIALATNEAMALRGHFLVGRDSIKSKFLKVKAGSPLYQEAVDDFDARWEKASKWNPLEESLDDLYKKIGVVFKTETDISTKQVLHLQKFPSSTWTKLIKNKYHTINILDIWLWEPIFNEDIINTLKKEKYKLKIILADPFSDIPEWRSKNTAPDYTPEFIKDKIESNIKAIQRIYVQNPNIELKLSTMPFTRYIYQADRLIFSGGFYPNFPETENSPCEELHQSKGNFVYMVREKELADIWNHKSIISIDLNKLKFDENSKFNLENLIKDAKKIKGN